MTDLPSVNRLPSTGIGRLGRDGHATGFEVHGPNEGASWNRVKGFGNPFRDCRPNGVRAFNDALDRGAKGSRHRFSDYPYEPTAT